MRSPESYQGNDIAKESLRQMIGGEPEVLFLMSGGIAPRKASPSERSIGEFKPTTIADPDLHDGSTYGYLGGIYRALATERLANLFPNASIITNSRDPKTHASHAEVYKELLLRRGINGNRITTQEKSENTRGEFKEMIAMSLDKNWNGPIAMLTNDYHIERSTLTFASLNTLYPEDENFLKQLEAFQNSNIRATFVSAEKVLGLLEPRYKKFFGELKSKEPFATAIVQRELAESNGIRALLDNTYQKRF